MIHSNLVQPLLLELLEPCPTLTEILPLSASLISLVLQKPLLSCISKLARDKEEVSDKSDAVVNTNLLNDSDISYINNSNLMHDANENTLLLQSSQVQNHNNNNNNNRNITYKSNADSDSNDSQNHVDSIQHRIENLQHQIEKIDETYDTDYINANVNPIDNLNILSLMAIKDWNQRTTIKEKWQVYAFGNYRLYLYQINEKFAILLCTTAQYPSSLAISRLNGVCSSLATKME